MPSAPNPCDDRIRMRRLFRREDGRMLLVPLDHSVTIGPITRGQHLDRLVAQIASNGADAIVLHKGGARHVDPRQFVDTALCVHLSASTVHASDSDAKYLVCTVEEALRMGADAVSVHVNLGSRSEARQIADLAEVARQCREWGLPLLAMVYPRGPAIEDPRDPGLVAHAVALAADLGADIVKTTMADSVEAMADITGDAPIPVLVAGGARRNRIAEALEVADTALAGGAAGVAVGRNVFQADDPARMTRSLADRVHSALPVEAAGPSEPVSLTTV